MAKPAGPKPAEPGSILGRMSLSDYVKYCCTGRLPQQVVESLKEPSYLRDLATFADLIGGLEPLSATRPGVCDVVAVIDRDIPVGVATRDSNNNLVETEEKVISVCAPMNKPLVVEILRVTAANLTAAEQLTTRPEFKRVNLGGFGEWCLPFEPHDAPRQFVNVEHIIVPAEAGFSLFVKNDNEFSEALYHLRARMWASC